MSSSANPRGLMRSGSGTPLVLLHGVTGSSAMWRDVVPLLSPFHDVIVPTALGHRGGNPTERHPARIVDVIDDAERTIRKLGFETVHLAGNSMGGWVALELARRGLARSVCALSPAGTWTTSERDHATKTLMATLAATRRARLLVPLLAHSSTFRRWALRDNAAHGERVSRAAFLELADDLLGCVVAHDLLRTDEQLSAVCASCPITLAWAEHDRIFPLARSGPIAQSLVPQAHFEVLSDVGHVPMLDNPELVARAILRSTACSASEAA